MIIFCCCCLFMNAVQILNLSVNMHYSRIIKCLIWFVQKPVSVDTFCNYLLVKSCASLEPEDNCKAFIDYY